jgi:hypothetical protein
MIVWGGRILNTGRRYYPEQDSSIATSTTGAPSGRYDHTAVWTGSEMIAWGGVGLGGSRGGNQAIYYPYGLFTIGGTITGLAVGNSLVLQNNGGDDLTIHGNGNFTFPTGLRDGGAYDVVIQTQPAHPKHHCSVSNGSGNVAGVDVTDVQVSCVVDQLFGDVLPGHWAYPWIQTLGMSGITGGCGDGNYCPDVLVSRDQMAIFLERGINGSDYMPPPATGTLFDDVPQNYWAADWIEQLAADGITGGCGGGNYCPDHIVTRAQVALFLLRSLYGSAYVPPPATGAMFDDVPGDYWAAEWIEQLAVEGISGGCDANNYCPDALVSRDQMAVFLVRTFDL